MVKGMDRRVLMGIVPGLAGLALGTAGAVAASPVLALLAGACALICAAAAVSAVGALRRRDVEASELRRRIDDLEEALDAGREAIEVTGRFAEMMATREIQATEATLEPAVNRESGLLDERYFEVMLESRVATARRHLQPVTLLLVTLEGEEENPAAWKETLISFCALLQETLREADTACRIGDASFAIVLEDTPEAGGVWAAERLRMALVRKGETLVRLAAGVAAYPSHALAAGDLLSRAQGALNHARAAGCSQVEIATTE
jgi:diguanylate cyclase (GGDEF)-like protein